MNPREEHADPEEGTMTNEEMMSKMQTVLQAHAANGPPAAPVAPAVLAPLAPPALAAPGLVPPAATPPAAFAGAPAWAAPAPTAGALPPPQGWSIPIDVPASNKYGQGSATIHLAFSAETFPMAPQIIEAVQQAGYNVRIYVPKQNGGGFGGGNRGGGFNKGY